MDSGVCHVTGKRQSGGICGRIAVCFLSGRLEGTGGMEYLINRLYLECRNGFHQAAQNCRDIPHEEC